MRLKIVSTGLYAPPHVETADDLAPRIGRDAEWIRSRTWVDRRHIALDEGQDDMGAHAATAALGDGPAPDLILSAAGSVLQALPDGGPFLAGAMGISGTPAFTVHASCLSFLVGLQVAGGLITSGAYRRVLLVSAEKSSQSRNYAHPESASLLGDGAGAAVVEATPPGEDSALLGFEMSTWPEGAHFTEVRGGGTRFHPNDETVHPDDNRFHMDGRAVYKLARYKVEEAIERLYARTGLGRSDIDLCVPHQASGLALRSLAKVGFEEDDIVNVIGEYGNCVAASLPMALHTAVADGRIQRGNHILLLGTGAGLSVVAALLRW